MKINRLVPIVSTTKLKESKEFYTKYFGFHVLFDSDWYVQLASQDDNLQMAFIVPSHESQPSIFQSHFDGKGVFYTLEVDDVDNELQRLKGEEGLEIVLDIRDESWGERHFAVKDPNDIVINVSQIIPSKGD